jgi:basic membrane protein A and related proteins
VNRSVRSRQVYLNSFDDAAAGREAALALIAAGADMFHHNADAAALGLFQAVKEHPGVYVFGANADQSRLAPGHVPGSAIIDLPRAFLLVASAVKSGSFRPHVEVFGLKSGVVRYQADRMEDSLIPPLLSQRIRAAADSIAAGTLKPAPRPTSMEARVPSPGRVVSQEGA